MPGLRGASPVAVIVVGLLSALTGGAVSGPLLALVMGSAAAFAALRLSTRQTKPTSAAPSLSVSRQLPAALDLLAACMAAGASAERALAAVGAAFDGQIGDVLVEVGRLATLGAPIETAWVRCLGDPRLAPVARVVIRAHHSGAALTDVLTHLADDRRRALRSDAQVAAQRAGVRAVLPLGVCFLPAFVFVGVVPVVAGFARTLWS
jgi:pilus assembly protein TadC